MSADDSRTVYVALVDEGVDCWRPAQAQFLGGDRYVLHGPIPEGETWEFQPGEAVRCRERTLEGGLKGWVAFARV